MVSPFECAVIIAQLLYNAKPPPGSAGAKVQRLDFLQPFHYAAARQIVQPCADGLVCQVYALELIQAESTHQEQQQAGLVRF
jgi:hypothetical protein